VLTLLALNHAPPLKPFVPREFDVPRSLATSDFTLQALTLEYEQAGFDAVSGSADHLQALFGRGWPQGLTQDQYRIELAWHQKEFERRTSFAYAVMSGRTEDMLGSVYVTPSDRSAFDAEVRYWVRSNELASGLQEKLGTVVADWMEDIWPFINPRYVPRLRSPRARLH